MVPESANKQANSPTRRTDSPRSALLNPKSRFKPVRMLSPIGERVVGVCGGNVCQ